MNVHILIPNDQFPLSEVSFHYFSLLLLKDKLRFCTLQHNNTISTKKLITIEEMDLRMQVLNASKSFNEKVDKLAGEIVPEFESNGDLITIN